MDKELEYLILYLKIKMGIILDISGAELIRQYFLEYKSFHFKKELIESKIDHKRTNGKTAKLSKMEVDEIYLFCKSLTNCTNEDIDKYLSNLTHEDKCNKSKLRTRAATRTNIIVVLIFLFIFVFIKGVIIHYVTEMNSNKMMEMQFKKSS